ncbi:MAG: IS5 family transposase [Desulfobacterales bacterium]|nr:IS5 family transposase [Desulfobacterales bacterium]MDP6808704.1 IS5 family transposase [Desulfobacterales bacterium]
MGFKKMDNSLGFADLTLASSLKHNRILKLMKKLDKAIDWTRVETILLSHFTVGTSSEGADAYPQLLLFKCMLLQKWFRINSDPELENQINDRLSFKKFLDLSFSKPSPDHSTFSRFRSRLSKNAMDQINSEILRQFETKGLTINEGIAIDARLVKTTSRPVSNEKLKELKEKNNTPEGKLDKNGKPKKFSRDLDSDWVVQKDKPHYGLKEQTAVDTNHGFIMATTISPCSVNDIKYLPYCTVYSRHTKQPIEKVFADKGYAGKPNRDFLAENKIADSIMRKDSTTAKLTEFEIERNKKISKVRYIVEQYFGISHLKENAKRTRFPQIATNKFDCWYRQTAYNISKRLKISRMATV